MIRGLIYYQRTIKGCSKVKWLIGFQGAQFIYLVVNEFVFHNMAGIYVNLLLCSYGHFLTFCIVTDWCTTTPDDNKNNCAHVTNRVPRIFFHVFALVLLCCVWAARSCEENLYPFMFCFLGLFILSQQVFDLALYWNDYLIDFKEMPKVHINRLWYNEELFRKQTKVLFLANILFGTFSCITIGVGFKFMNANDDDPEKVDFLLCYNGNQWIENSWKGSLFMMCHQILILLQINASQMVLIRIPNNMDLFEHKNMSMRVGDGIRSRLLADTIDSELGKS